jgi:CHAT domain-containing protein
VVGIAWAFLMAGCPTTVVSQWKADSAATAELMVAFHKHLRAGAPPADPLRRAQRELRRNPRYRDPLYWAAFIVLGADR